MRKTLYFPESDCKNLPRNNYITISKNKLVEYVGIYPIALLIEPNNRGRQNGKVYLNDKYTIKRIDKHDRFAYNVKGTHMIGSQMLEDYVHAPCFVKLNFFDCIYTKWYLKGYYIQDVNFKKDLWKILLGAIIGSIVTLIASSLIK